MSYMVTNRSDKFGGNWSTNLRQFSSPTCVLKPCNIFWIIACRSLGGFTHDAIASQKNMKSGTTPTGFTVIMLHIPRNAESFSSLSRICRNDVHLSCEKRERTRSNSIFNALKWVVVSKTENSMKKNLINLIQ